ncbi:tetratricopeptide repeat-containing sensor histidine kinase [Croceivirga thetidis]|uniref:histidine kinase n=1 Tax=Croceivirga thetidis TaxID=2721623 RepID=A0ABX1GMT8_9FLAO|nr:tetratricopeptide repeat protein [Croceivirga thetidis]NKI30963.1 sensor histidine kinase [Croceivirga thetidis]
MRAFKVSIGFIFCCFFGFSQNLGETILVDSLKQNLTRKGISAKTIDSDYVQLLLDISTAYASKNKDSLYHYANKAKILSEEKGYSNLTVLSYRNIGFFHSDQGNNKKALEHYCTALDICDKSNLLSLKPDLLRLIGDEYYYLGDFENSLNGLLEAIDIASQNEEKNLLMLSISNKNIARLFLTQKDYPTVLEFYKKTLELNERLDNEDVKGITFANLAEIYIEMNNTAMSTEYIDKSIAHFKTGHRPKWLAFAYGVKGRIYLAEQDFEKALEWLKKSEDQYSKLDEDRNETITLIAMGKVHFLTNNLTIAKNYGQRAYNLAREIGDIHSSIESVGLLFEIEKIQNNATKALKYHEEFKFLSDSILNVNNNRGLNLYKAQVKYTQEKKNLILENNERVAKQKQILVYAAIIVILLISTLVPLYFKQKKLNILNNELNLKTAELVKREKDLSNANSSKDLIFSILGHDLKGPMAALHSLLEMYSEGLSKKKLSDYIPKLKLNVENILFTLTNLLNWGHSQLNGLTMKRETFELNDIVTDNINFLSGAADLKNVAIKNDLKDSIPVNADKNQISLVVRNLLSNALKFTPAGGNAVEIFAIKNDTNWTVSVKDYGVGIPNSIANTLFKESHYQTTKGTNLEKGTGLGLMISRKMVLNNGGEIWFENNKNHGTTFSFTIPMGTN